MNSDANKYCIVPNETRISIYKTTYQYHITISVPVKYPKILKNRKFNREVFNYNRLFAVTLRQMLAWLPLKLNTESVRFRYVLIFLI